MSSAREGNDPGRVPGMGLTVGSRDPAGPSAPEHAAIDALRQVTRDAAHDLNNLLMAVSGYATLALMDLAADSPERDAVERVESTTRAAADLTRQLLEFTGADPAGAGASDVASAIAGIDGLLRIAAGRGTDVRLELSGSLPSVAVPRRALQRAIVFLALAGRDHLGEGQGTLTLRGVVREGDRLAIDLAWGRTGVAGDADEDAWRDAGEVASTGRADPMLSGVAAEIARYGGVVERDPARMAVEVLVPVAPGAGGEARPARATGLPGAWPPGRTPVVLVVDDEEAVRRVAGRLLESIGCVAELVDGGTRAIERFRADPGHYDAVLLDLSMPDLAGIDALERLREARPDVAVVLMSGYAPDDLTAALRGKAVTFLQKPFSRASLLDALEEVLSTTLPGSTTPGA